MLKSDRIYFINPEDRAQRGQDLLKILEGDGIEKSKLYIEI